MTRPRYFAIFAAMRTGSNLLETTLDAQEGLVGLGELFNPGFIGSPGVNTAFGWRMADRDRDPVGFLEAVIAAHPGKTPGFRLFDGHDRRLLAHAAADPAAAAILLTRAPLESFISLRIAQATGQWLLRNEARRKLARVRFDAAEFEAYRDRLERHHAEIRARLRAAGRGWVEIDYTDMRDPVALAGVARYAGAAKPAIGAPRIHRQNPPALEDKVENMEALLPYLDARIPAATAPGGEAPVAAMGDKWVTRLLLARNARLIAAPLPGAGAGAVRELLAACEAALGAGEAALDTGFGERILHRWRLRGATVFTFARHPEARLRAVFAHRILNPKEKGMDAARAEMSRLYGAPALEEIRRSDEARSAGFGAFLEFIADNLAGRSAAPTSLAWAPQTMLLKSLSAEFPVDFVGRVEQGERDARMLLERAGVPDPGPVAAAFGARAAAADGPAPTPGQAARIRSLYAEDYSRFGYPA